MNADGGLFLNSIQDRPNVLKFYNESSKTSREFLN